VNKTGWTSPRRGVQPVFAPRSQAKESGFAQVSLVKVDQMAKHGTLDSFGRRRVERIEISLQRLGDWLLELCWGRVSGGRTGVLCIHEMAFLKIKEVEEVEDPKPKQC